MSNTDTVRASMEAYHNQDIDIASRLLADDETQVFFGGRV